MNWKKILLLDLVLTTLYVVVIDMASKVQANPSFPNFALKRPDGTLEHFNFWAQSATALVFISIFVFGLWGACIAVKSAWKGLRG